MDTLSDWSLRRGAPQKKIGWGTLGAPRLNNQSDRVSILRMGTSKDRSAKLWIIAKPDMAYLCINHREHQNGIFRATDAPQPDSNILIADDFFQELVL
jgi:hypothetical protein